MKIFDKLISENKFLNFDEFLQYFYFYFDKLIKNEKKQKVKNKYIKIRNNMLSYIVANKQSIVKKLNVKK